MYVSKAISNSWINPAYPRLGRKGKTAYLVVLDGLGIGQNDTLFAYEDKGAHTLQSIAKKHPLNIPNLTKLGLGYLAKGSQIPMPNNPKAKLAIMRSASAGKDTTTGHWELSGYLIAQPFPTYPEGFPKEVIERFEELSGYGVIGNKPASGTEILKELGPEHMKTAKLIVYTSADSVFQIAAHEDIVPVQELYRVCEIARSQVLIGEHAVARIIARPFIGQAETGFVRTPRRHDYSLSPKEDSTVMNQAQSHGINTTSVGKIIDIFAGQGFDNSYPTTSNAHGMEVLSRLQSEKTRGLVFANLVDFDMVYGHRRDSLGFAKGLEEFDLWLGEFVSGMDKDELLILVADHGCDPCFCGSDHTNEDVPILIYSPALEGGLIDNRIGLNSFAAVSKVLAEWLSFEFKPSVQELNYAPMIATSPELDKLYRLFKRLSCLGFDFYLVGGALRDLLLGLAPRDFDFCMRGKSQISFEELFASESDVVINKQNPEFGTASCTFRGIDFDIAWTRAEEYSSSTHYPLVGSMEFNVSLEEDVKRRDFSINSLYLSMTKEPQLIDLVDGHFSMLAREIKVLHDESFNDDPTRIARGLNFAKRFGLRLDAKTARLAEEAINREETMKKLSIKERNELMQALGALD